MGHSVFSYAGTTQRDLRFGVTQGDVALPRFSTKILQL